MTVTATSYAPITYNGNGSTSVFNITFQFYEIAVIHIDSSGSETEWVENTHYTVTGGEGSTGSITATPTVPATGEKLRIERRTSKDQPRDYDLDNAVLEAALQQSDDRLAMILQELDYDNRRRPAISTANFTAEVEFPTASTGSVLSWAADGNLANTALVDLDGVAISALSTTASLEDTDLLPLYDNSAGDNAAITWANVKSGLGLGALAALDTVATAQIDDNAVVEAKIEDNAITPIKMAENILADGTDLNTVIESGSYRTQANGLNWPNASTQWSQLIVSKNADTIFQMIAVYNNEIYTRTGWGINYAPAFTPWKKLETNLGELHLQHQQASGTNGGTPTLSSWTKYTLNTSVKNDISGASLSSSVITLPVGTYEISAGNWHQNLGNGKLRLRNTTDSTTEVLGESTQGPGSNEQVRLVLYGEFTLGGIKDLELQYYRTNWTGGTDSLGQAVSQGTEIYGDVLIRKVA